jgi:dephospho-CoA kinase
MNESTNPTNSSNRNVLVGLTGSIGAGKSTVARIFTEAGIPVLHADEIARELMSSDPEMIAAVTAILGPDAYSNGVLDRRHVAEAIFNDREKLDAINKAVHPRTIVRQGELAAELFRSGERVVACEAALIFESGGEGRFDYIVVVDAERERRLARAAERDGLDIDEVRRREESQMSAAKKVTLADFVIRNDGTLAELESNSRFIAGLLAALPPRASIEREEEEVHEDEDEEGDNDDGLDSDGE